VLSTWARTVESLVRTEFQTGQDPFGKPWAPLKIRRGQPLVKSGRLAKQATTVKTFDTGIEIDVDLVYAAVHEFGATIHARHAKALRFKAGRRFVLAKQVTIPARPYLPEGELPPKWRDRLSAETDRLLWLELSAS
jgi:phage gpG-like protein